MSMTSILHLILDEFRCNAAVVLKPEGYDSSLIVAVISGRLM